MSDVVAQKYLSYFDLVQQFTKQFGAQNAVRMLLLSAEGGGEGHRRWFMKTINKQQGYMQNVSDVELNVISYSIF